MKKPNCCNGQSLVEMALFMPLMILMLIGVLEVGYLIRNYMTVMTANREMVRIAAKSSVSLDEARRHFDVALAGQVATPTLLVRLSQWEAEPIFPCDPDGWLSEAADGDYWPTCDCQSETAMLQAIPVVTLAGEPIRLDFHSFSRQLALENNVVNCMRLRFVPKNAEKPEGIEVAVGEVIYSHFQLLGFPGLHLADPIEIYDVFRMRVVQSREQ